MCHLNTALSLISVPSQVTCSIPTAIQQAREKLFPSSPRRQLLREVWIVGVNERFVTSLPLLADTFSRSHRATASLHWLRCVVLKGYYLVTTLSSQIFRERGFIHFLLKQLDIEVYVVGVSEPFIQLFTASIPRISPHESMASPSELLH